jgi:uncharacterized protein YuzE
MAVGFPEGSIVGVAGIGDSKLFVDIDSIGTIVGVRVLSSQVHW